MQLANLAATIANRGWFKTPHLVKKISNSKIKKEFTLKKYTTIDSIHYEKIINGMYNVIEKGTAQNAKITGIEVVGKTGTAEQVDNSIYSNTKINTLASIFPIENPKYVLVVMLESTKNNKEYIYEYRDGSGFKLKGSPRNTAGWTSAEAAGKIIDKIGPILATKYIEN